ncbi:hypothetical protein [Endozoicomonas ascidiicola]|uniref:hypothetical protein n=1 Tax=Endozoicomonas ascidiicola TaxID=1698521 RepID=UPI00082A4A09|nr:hypothetical protein [Endozoicomonas ascidiicola]
MNFCPSINLIGNRCLSAPFIHDTQLARGQKFAEEMSFAAALFRQFHVRHIPDTGQGFVLHKLWLEMKKRRVTKKEKSEQLWFGKRQPEEHQDTFEEHHSMDKIL